MVLEPAECLPQRGASASHGAGNAGQIRRARSHKPIAGKSLRRIPQRANKMLFPICAPLKLRLLWYQYHGNLEVGLRCMALHKHGPFPLLLTLGLRLLTLSQGQTVKGSLGSVWWAFVARYSFPLKVLNNGHRTTSAVPKHGRATCSES